MKTFRYKLDFYYQISLIYFVTVILYIVIRGAVIDDRFEYVYRDPLLFIMVFFLLLSFGMLILNRIRNRRVVVEERIIRFKSNLREWDLPIDDIEWMHITRERNVQTSGRLQVVIIKQRNRRRLIRIRVGRYERPEEFLGSMRDIAERVPKRVRDKKEIRN